MRARPVGPQRTVCLMTFSASELQGAPSEPWFRLPTAHAPPAHSSPARSIITRATERKSFLWDPETDLQGAPVLAVAASRALRDAQGHQQPPAIKAGKGVSPLWDMYELQKHGVMCYGHFS